MQTVKNKKPVVQKCCNTRWLGEAFAPPRLSRSAADGMGRAERRSFRDIIDLAGHCLTRSRAVDVAGVRTRNRDRRRDGRKEERFLFHLKSSLLKFQFCPPDAIYPGYFFSIT